jgi:hypothetical protein
VFAIFSLSLSLSLAAEFILYCLFSAREKGLRGPELQKLMQVDDA